MTAISFWDVYRLSVNMCEVSNKYCLQANSSLYPPSWVLPRKRKWNLKPCMSLSSFTPFNTSCKLTFTLFPSFSFPNVYCIVDAIALFPVSLFLSSVWDISRGLEATYSVCFYSIQHSSFSYTGDKVPLLCSFSQESIEIATSLLGSLAASTHHYLMCYHYI